jgi:signal transduction histidine kinase
MEERAQLAGGRLELNTAPGRGTEVRVVFPLAEGAT